MTNSFRKIDYRLRPAKHAERLMLVDAMKRMRFTSLESYRYIGFGSVGFIDHKLVHRAGGLRDLISIEGNTDEDVMNRFRANLPLSCIDLRFGMSSDILPNIDCSMPTIAWLDYDDQVNRAMMHDLQTLALSIPPGSFVAITFTVSFPVDLAKQKQELERLREQFPEYLSEDSRVSELEHDGLPRLARSIASELFEMALSNADAGKPAAEKRRLEQICFLKYRDGAPMCTLVWIVTSEATRARFEEAAFDQLPYYSSGDDAFVIRIPKVTPLEIREMERRLPDLDVPELAWIPEPDRRNFSAIYRYLPTFASIEPF